MALSIVLLVMFVVPPPVTDVLEAVVSKEPGRDDLALAWHRTEWVPAVADNILSGFVESHRGFTEGYPHAGSNIDTEVQFHSVADVVRYIPCALQFALFAPFPTMWGETGASPGATQMRLLAGIEMAFAYLVLPGAMLVFIRRERYGPAAVALIQAVVPMIVLALIVSNVGTLYRMRYGYWQILMGLGIIGWGMWLQHWNTKYRRIAD